MKTSEILKQFTWQAAVRGMDLSGDKGRWFNGKTARAWTAWLTKARGAA
jgi:hypothetical protein